jgi:hypothetical protein
MRPDESWIREFLIQLIDNVASGERGVAMTNTAACSSGRDQSILFIVTVKTQEHLPIVYSSISIQKFQNNLQACDT